MSQSGRYTNGSGAPGVEKLTGNTGGPVPPTAGNINVVGDGVTVNVAGNPGTSTLTISATDAVAIQYTEDVGVATPALGNLNIIGGDNISTLGNADIITIRVNGTTDHALQVGNAAGSLTSLAAATNGQIPIGSTGADPVISTITAGAGITVTNGAGSITVSSAGSVATTYNEDVGSATPAANVLNIIGGTSTGGTATNINTRGAGSTVEVCLNNSISQPDTNGTGSQGLYSLGGNRFLHNYPTGSRNTYLGAGSGNLTNVATDNVGIGFATLSNTGAGGSNVAIGSFALQANVNGIYNNAIGYRALAACNGGVSNVAIGTFSQETNISGNRNIGVGYQTLNKLTTAQDNIAIGMQSLANITTIATASNNTTLGNGTLATATQGNGNTVIGFNSMLSSTSIGDFNTTLGTSALQTLLTGARNTAVGYRAGIGYTSSESSNIVIGNEGTATDSNTIRIGTSGSGDSQQNRCFVAGINGVNVGSVASVVSINGDQLGSATITAGAGITVTPGANTITISGSGTDTYNYTNVNTTPYVVQAADQYLGVDSSGGARTIQLPNAPATGKTFVIKDRTGSANTNNITVTTVGGAVNIDGATSYTMNTQYSSINVLFDGSTYQIF